MIVRKIDELGRVVLPTEFRKVLSIGNNDDVNIHIENGKVIIEKHTDTCVFCGNENNLIVYNNKRICKSCISNLANDN